jgi:hypothetical protein
MAQNGRKLHVLVRMSQPGQSPIEGTVFLSSLSSRGDGPQTLSELLNRPERFIPFHRNEDGSTLLVARRHLQWVAASTETDRELLKPPENLSAREELVLIRFLDGSEVRGLIQMNLPSEQSRASDYMNCPDDFFPLSTTAGLLFVNKHAIVDTLVYETSPVPALPESCEA